MNYLPERGADRLGDAFAHMFERLHDRVADRMRAQGYDQTVHEPAHLVAAAEIPGGDRLLGEDEWAKEATDAADVLSDLVVQGAGAASVQYGFDVYDPDLEAAVARHVETLTAHAPAMRQQMTDWISESQRNGKSIDEMVAALGKSSPLSPSRAQAWARTESVRAYNAGAATGLAQAGFGFKQWLATSDDRTRDWHASADGQIVAIDQPFIVGGEAGMYPGDPSFSAKNTVNCRCTVIAAEDDGTPIKPPDPDDYDDPGDLLSAMRKKCGSTVASAGPPRLTRAQARVARRRHMAFAAKKAQPLPLIAPGTDAPFGRNAQGVAVNAWGVPKPSWPLSQRQVYADRRAKVGTPANRAANRAVVPRQQAPSSCGATIDTMTVSQLRVAANQMGVRGRSTMIADELRDALRAKGYGGPPLPAAAKGDRGFGARYGARDGTAAVDLDQHPAILDAKQRLAAKDRIDGMSVDSYGQYRHLDPVGQNMPFGDGLLQALQRAQGFDARAELVGSVDDVMKAAEANGQKVIYRGLTGDGKLGEMLRTGDHFPGNGVYGQGTYFTTDAGEARGYGRDINIAALKAGAKVLTISDANKLAMKNFRKCRSGAATEAERMASGDPGRVAALHGFDAVHVAEGNGLGEFFVVLNRGALIMAKYG